MHICQLILGKSAKHNNRERTVSLIKSLGKPGYPYAKKKGREGGEVTKGRTEGRRKGGREGQRGWISILHHL
jgi:hypothetical protein